MTLVQRLVVFLLTLIATVAVIAATEDGDFDPLFEVAGSSRLLRADVPDACMSDEMKEQLRLLMLEALDEAFKDRVNHLFSTWLRDEQGQPGRARVGTTLAINAYVHAKMVFEKWDPPKCPV